MEVRVYVPSAETLNQKLQQIKARSFEKINFDDEIYKPSKNSDPEWENLSKSLRIRKLPDSTYLFFDKVRYRRCASSKHFVKHSVYSGKVLLYKGNVSLIRKLLRDLGFEYWFSVEHSDVRTYIVDSPINFKCTVEQVNHIGSMVEIEVSGKDVNSTYDNLMNALQTLGIDHGKIISTSLPRLVAMRLGKDIK